MLVKKKQVELGMMLARRVELSEFSHPEFRAARRANFCTDFLDSHDGLCQKA